MNKQSSNEWADKYRVSTDEKARRRSALSREELMALLDYDPHTGAFTTRVRRGPIKAGVVAGTMDDEGRIVITINYVRHFAHRLAWLYMNGSWPDGEIDHRDTDRSNNRWVNLRDVSSTVNKQNKRRAQSGKKYSRLLGAQWCKQAGKWKSSIRANGKIVHLGFFGSDAEAAEAYVIAKRRMHEGCTL